MLKLENISKRYSNGTVALNEISLEIESGMFGLLGPNGAGKSSLMRTIATIQKPDSGFISLDGVDILSNEVWLRKRLGYLPQEFGVYPRISAERLLIHLAKMKQVENAKEVALDLLQQVNLFAHKSKSVAQYSGGMKQRFGIAQALIGNPRLIIVDEPTAGLDPAERNRFHNLLAEISDGTIVILSTHIVEDVANLCSRMAIMSEGKILVEGETQQLSSLIDGEVWYKLVTKEERDRLADQHTIISQRMKNGQHMITINSMSDPGNDFKPKKPDLEDLYFTTLHSETAEVIA